MLATLAMLFIEEFPGKRVFYSILLMPMMVVPAVAGYMFFMLFQSGGPVNDILALPACCRLGDDSGISAKGDGFWLAPRRPPRAMDTASPGWEERR